MMTDGGMDPQSNQNSDAPFQTGASDNEAPPGTPAGASPPAFSGSSWSSFYSPVHGLMVGTLVVAGVLNVRRNGALGG